MSNFMQSKGEAVKNKVAYAKFGMGVTQIRLVGDLLPGYVYWLENTAKNKFKAPNLAFDPKTEAWIKGAVDPVCEFGFTEKNEKGETVPLKSKRDYQIQIINRASGKLEVMSLSKTMFDAIVAYCRDTGVEDPTTIELFIEKTGDANKWNSIRYKLNEVRTMKFNADTASVAELHEKDATILAEMKPIAEMFPRPTADELREQITNFLNNTKEDDADAGSPASPADASAKEALNDLD